VELEKSRAFVAVTEKFKYSKQIWNEIYHMKIKLIKGFEPEVLKRNYIYWIK
jgi:hypothetical protein